MMARTLGGEQWGQFGYEVDLDTGKGKLVIYATDGPEAKQLKPPAVFRWELSKEEKSVAEAAYTEEPDEYGFFPLEAELAHMMEERYRVYCDDHVPAFTMDEVMILPPL